MVQFTPDFPVLKKNKNQIVLGSGHSDKHDSQHDNQGELAFMRWACLIRSDEFTSCKRD